MKMNYAVGLWKFRENISPEQLVELAEKWAEEDPNYIQLYVRKASRNQYAIGFMYKLPQEESGPGQHDDYFNKTSDSLKRSFGNDLAGWDLASPAWIIK